MRHLKSILFLTVLCLLLSLCPTGIAEEEIISAPVDLEVGEAESIGINGLYSEDDRLFPDTDMRIDTSDKCQAISASSNGDFEIENGDILVHYGGIDKNVVIPDGIKEIRWQAFSGDEYMESIVIPNSVVSISWGVFYGCTALKSVVIPNSVTTLESEAFSECSSLKSVQISNNLSELQDYTFNGCKSLENVIIPNGITSIGYSCFSDCDSLTTVELPDSVTTIGEQAFGRCDNLESITIPASVTAIDRNAFKDSEKLVILGKSGTYAERYASAVGIPFNASIVTIRKDLYAEIEKENIEGHPYAYINQTFPLKAEQHPANLATTLKWSSSDTSIATVDQNGVVTGVGPGTAIITAGTINGRGRAAQVDFIVPESTSIEFTNAWGGSLDDPAVVLNETTEIFASIETPYSDITGIDMPVSFASSDDSIIRIESIGKNSDGDYKLVLKGCALGKATITATTPDNGKATIEVEVIRPDSESIKIGQEGPIHIKVGKTVALSAVIAPSDADQSLMIWSSDNADIATVNEKGVVTAVAEGRTYINVNIKDRFESDYVEVYVEPDNPTKITLNKTKATLYAGDTLSLKVSLTPEETETALTWTSSKPKVAKVSSKGKVTALKAGTTTVTVTAENGKTATAKITVKALPKSVTLDKTKASLGVKDTLTLKAALKPSDTVTKLTWKSSTTSVAKVSQKGVVTALKKGTAIITVTAENGKKATAKITVKPAPSKVTLYKGGKKLKSGATLSLKKGKTLQLKAKLPSGTLSTLTWSSDKPKVAKVSKKGVVTALKKGTATITVKTANGKKAKVKIKVK